MASSTDGKPEVDVPALKKEKRWIPLENNPAVFTSLAHTLGLSPTLSFHDVYSLNDPSLLSFLPRPCYALIFIAPMSPANAANRALEDKDVSGEYEGVGEGESVRWFQQTIGNACGLMALIHALANGAARDFVQKGSLLDGLLTKAVDLPMKERAELLYNSADLEEIYKGASVKGDSAVPTAAEEPDLHFICFVENKGRMWELDGGTRKGPLDRGEVGEGEDMLSEGSLERGVKRFIKWETEGEERFSVIALGPTFD